MGIFLGGNNHSSSQLVKAAQYFSTWILPIRWNAPSSGLPASLCGTNCPSQPAMQFCYIRIAWTGASPIPCLPSSPCLQGWALDREDSTWPCMAQLKDGFITQVPSITVAPWRVAATFGVNIFLLQSLREQGGHPEPQTPSVCPWEDSLPENNAKTEKC